MESVKEQQNPPDDRNRSSPPPSRRGKERDYKRRLSPSPPPHHKRSRRDDGDYDRRRRSPRGYGNDRKSGYENRGGRRYLGDRHDERYSDLDSGRGGYTHMSNMGNSEREGLLAYKQFMQRLDDDVTAYEALLRYEEYQTEYITSQKRTYFEAHKDENWLRNKYHPTNLLSVIERRNELAHKTSKNYLLDLESGGVPTANTNKSEQTSESNPVKEAELSAAPKAHPISSKPRRIQLDIELALELTKKLDSEKGIDGHFLVMPDKDINNRLIVSIRGLTFQRHLVGVELLDTLLTYLWLVHGVDYYGMIELTEPKGLRHVRAEHWTSEDSKSATNWEKKVDSCWNDRLDCQDSLEAMTAKDEIDAAADKALNPYVTKTKDEKHGWKYGCGVEGCTKNFKAPEFVYSHLKLKHHDLVMDLTSEMREDLYFQNYMNDPKAPGSQPVMQQAFKNDRRGPSLEDRSKDDRGGSKDREAQESANDKFKSSDKGDFRSSKDDSEKSNADEPMFDHFGVLVPIPGAGPLGPFVPAMPTIRQDPRSLRSYQDLDAPDDEVNVIDYRSL